MFSRNPCDDILAGPGIGDLPGRQSLPSGLRAEWGVARGQCRTLLFSEAVVTVDVVHRHGVQQRVHRG